MISISALHKSYGKYQVLKGIDLTIENGTVLGLVGPNACGKTTLMKCLLGLAHFSKGKVIIQNLDIEMGTEYRRMIGYMPQNPDFPGNLQVREILEMMEDLRGESAKFKNDLIEYFSLEDSLDKTFEVLSGGTKQKVAAVLAFMFEVPILILDEPTVGLDPVSGAKFKELVRTRAKSGATIIIVSHVLSELEQVATDIAFIFEGKVLATTSLFELKKKAGDSAGNSSLENAVMEIFLEKSRGSK
ncbi:MAG: ABC transporter ATP-binding protein [Bacteriovorax sp.]|nr:ABC transporter ATP-binding protein [Bacteriovorax sp.]